MLTVQISLEVRRGRTVNLKFLVFFKSPNNHKQTTKQRDVLIRKNALSVLFKNNFKKEHKIN